jgi:hypothetical protein
MIEPRKTKSGEEDGRIANHPWDNLPTLRLCNVCSNPLTVGSVEYLIGVHTWCVAYTSRRPQLRKGPSYGQTPYEDE